MYGKGIIYDKNGIIIYEGKTNLFFNFVIFAGAAVVAVGLVLTFTISMFYFAPKNPGYCLNSS